jgi:hypothetical protein
VQTASKPGEASTSPGTEHME